MKKAFLFLTMLIPCISYGDVANPCSTGRVLTKVRPGAAWSMQDDSIKTLKWLDTTQKKPSVAEVQKAQQACIADTANREALKKQARLDVKNPKIPTDKKLEQLILLLDMDR